ncbi:endonuclease III domain-containing protein [Aspergillus fijiensis CBS 313.89]|uniref:Endonuclease III homolog n=1 Tax=Aspergillus fijiensis CBS 313.89 TaxID=1448319 RepID=A0A8G1RMB5_9EURO|nr:uncharacterized protein BO72DRAFT_433054 [Aspergillus fijiensis CBS 313.89]RAK75389.1 hypothetical protein BO72DRAFT_433054 [Aspergillus fijiensis CBS 313.89]
MRTSRTAKETARVVQALSPPGRRQTRSSSAHASVLRSFAFNGGSNASASASASVPASAEAVSDDDDTSSLSSVPTVDIEDILEPPAKRRKSALSAPSARGSRNRTARTPANATQTSLKVETTVKEEVFEKPAARSRRVPARKVKVEDGTYTVEPPSNWETIYTTVKKMREDNPTAPVDTMGCAELYWRASSPRDRRFQTLIALMLSSQTKDTVTAVAMQRLHTELGDGPPVAIKAEPNDDNYDSKALEPMQDSTLNLENILAVSPERLNELIRTVGFHNNKTKYIKAAALIIRDQYDSDIPSTPTELMSLPGVGPKMAFLCMSAAWGKHEGIGVDVHVHRITNLWGWHKTKTPEETRKALESWLPKDKWHEINKLLVGLGQTVCLPIGRRCGDCDLAGTKLCKSEIRGMASKVKKTIVYKAESGVAPQQFISDDSGGSPKVKVEKQAAQSEVVVQKPRITFMDLPYVARVRILEYAGLLRNCVINFRYEAVRRKHNGGTCLKGDHRHYIAPSPGIWIERDCNHPKLPIELFSISRATREEAGAVFFSHNRFNAPLSSRTDYNSFESSFEWGLHRLRYLHLDLSPKEHRYLKLAGGVHRTSLRIWISFCLLAHSKMHGLKYFSMTCKVRELEVAQRLMREMNPFPVLLQCAFHFGHNYEEHTQKVIRRAALRVTNTLAVKPQFPYFRLPREIQFMILELLLVDHPDPFLPKVESLRGVISLQDRKKAMRPSSFLSMNCCLTCSPVGAICFCRGRHTAFSTSCSCLESPLNYFLVSRDFYRDARQIFYSRNKFAFLDEDPEFMLQFLNKLPTSTTELMRHLILKFPSHYRDTPRTGPRSNESTLLWWSVLRRFIREHFKIPNLSLTIVDMGWKGMVSGEPRRRYLKKLLEGMLELRGLRDYRLYLSENHELAKDMEVRMLGEIVYQRARGVAPFSGPKNSQHAH